MTANLERDGHVSIHVPTETRGTGDHDHHRATIEHEGVRQAYWRCRKGIGDTRHCPDEPDPWEALTRKWAEGVMARAAAVKPPRDRCRYGHAAEFQRRNSQGSAYCQECNRLSNLRARMKRKATAIVTDALAA